MSFTKKIELSTTILVKMLIMDTRRERTLGRKTNCPENIEPSIKVSTVDNLYLAIHITNAKTHHINIIHKQKTRDKSRQRHRGHGIQLTTNNHQPNN